MSTRKKHPVWIGALFFIVLPVICVGSVKPAIAAPNPAPSTPQPRATPTLPPTPVPGNTQSTSSSGNGGSVMTQIYETIVKFANDTVASGLMFGLGTLVRGMAEESAPSLDQGINTFVGKLTTNDTQGFDGSFTSLWEVRYNAWKALLVVAALLLPVTLLASVINAMRGGMSSFTSRSDAKEALIQWIGSVALAGSSFFLLYQGFRFSEALNGYLDTHLLVEELSGAGAGSAAGMVFGTGLVSTIILALSVVFPPAAAFTGLIIFCFFFVLIGAVFIFFSLALASLAKDVILIVVVSIAPLVCILSAVQPFRWVFNAWEKVALGALLLVPGNTLLWRIGRYLVFHTFNNASLMNAGDVFIAILLWIGVASLITGLNFSVGKLVYSAAMEVANKAVKATMDTAACALSAVGFAAGVGAVGGGSISATAIPGPLGGNGAGGGFGGLGASAGSAGSGLSASLASDPSVLGNFLKSTGIPGVSDFGAGLSSGFRTGNQAAPNRSLNSGKGLSDTPQSGVNSALSKMEGTNAFESDKNRIGQIQQGTQTAEETLKLPEGSIAAGFGNSSHEEYYMSAAGKGQLAPRPKEDAPMWSGGASKVRDVHFANEAMVHFNEPLNSPRYRDVVMASHYSRTRMNESPQKFLGRAQNYEPGQIDKFLTDEGNIRRQAGVNYSS